MTEQNDIPELPEEIKALADECLPKHVAVVQAILSGEYDSNTAAYRSVYGSEDPDSARANVARMLAIDSVKELMKALRETHLIKGILTRDEALVILTDMARTSMGDIADFSSQTAGEDENGESVSQSTWSFKDSKNMSESALRSISELNATRDGLKIKQHDQKAAIKQISEMQGWEAPKRIDMEIGDSDYLKRLRDSLEG